DGALARDPGALRGPLARRARVSALGPRQDRMVEEQAPAQARPARPPSRRAPAGAETRIRGPDRRVAATRAARRDRGRARAGAAAAARVFRSHRGARTARRPLHAPAQPGRDPVGVTVLFGLAPRVPGKRCDGGSLTRIASLPAA